MDGDLFSEYDNKDPHFKALQRIGSLNSDAVFLSHEEEINIRHVKGDASESAIIKFFEHSRPIADYRQACKRVYAVPFNSTKKWMLAIHEQEDGKKGLILMVKGAPERIINMCSHQYLNGKVVEIDEV